jgi:hypothetical protein
MYIILIIGTGRFLKHNLARHLPKLNLLRVPSLEQRHGKLFFEYGFHVKYNGTLNLQCSAVKKNHLSVLGVSKAQNS